MSRTTKFYTTLVLCFGTAGGIVSIVRIIVLTKISNGPGSYAQGLRSGYWTQIETGMGIIAASLACLRPLLTLVREKLSSSPSNKTARTSTGGHTLTTRKTDTRSRGEQPPIVSKMYDGIDLNGTSHSNQQRKIETMVTVQVDMEPIAG
ncbi:hypothetical protein K461DRAFT_293856 [Myriangium duriaei CBS 260.36]|uniref:Rhodopsin domain-containing protein n=1 Tax=Myriangium duriaei CBS 260.36 TaxID=1168546 RepID=A0A9P4J533_9PEZI|nr:hypothetical protein K461DRAFT_293856 [Myriangium duriaei CBS 260.36]